MRPIAWMAARARISSGEEDGAIGGCGEVGVGVVGFVFAPGLLEFGEVGAELRAAEGEEGAEDGEAVEGGGGFHGGEAVDAGAPRMRRRRRVSSLVVGVVVHDDGGAFFGGVEGEEGSEPGGAGGGFAGGFFEAELFDGAGKREGFGESADEGGIRAASWAADAVVDVDDVKGPVPVVGVIDGAEEAQESNGVGAAGDGEEEACILRQEVAAMEGLVEKLNDTAGRRHLNSGFGVLSFGLLSHMITEENRVDAILGNSNIGFFENAESSGKINEVVDGGTLQNGERGERGHSFELGDFSISSFVDQDVLNMQFFGERNCVGLTLVERGC